MLIILILMLCIMSYLKVYAHFCYLQRRQFSFPYLLLLKWTLLRSVVLWLERWPCRGESAQQLWFDPNSLSVVSGVTTLRLANLPEKHSVFIYIVISLVIEWILKLKIP